MDEKTQLWEPTADEKKSKVIPLPPAIGCSCEPGGVVRCGWCSLSEEEREKLRNAVQP